MSEEQPDPKDMPLLDLLIIWYIFWPLMRWCLEQTDSRHPFENQIERNRWMAFGAELGRRSEERNYRPIIFRRRNK